MKRGSLTKGELRDLITLRVNGFYKQNSSTYLGFTLPFNLLNLM